MCGSAWLGTRWFACNSQINFSTNHVSLIIYLKISAPGGRGHDDSSLVLPWLTCACWETILSEVMMWSWECSFTAFCFVQQTQAPEGGNVVGGGGVGIRLYNMWKPAWRRQTSPQILIKKQPRFHRKWHFFLRLRQCNVFILQNRASKVRPP